MSLSVLLDELQPLDRRMAIFGAAASALLLFGLTVTGIWMFFDRQWVVPDLDLGSAEYRRSVESGAAGFDDAVPVSSMQALHDTCAELLAGVVLFITAFVSYRVLMRISWSSVLGMAVVAATMVTGEIVDFDFVVRNDRFSADQQGYWFVFRGEYDFLVAGERKFGPAAASLWMIMHLLSLPVILGIVAFVLRRAQRRTNTDG